MQARTHYRNRQRHRGAVTVYVAISTVVFIGIAALAVDMGALYSAQAELQRTADAAALAAAGQLMSADVGGYEDAAIEAASDTASRNDVLRGSAGLGEGDVEFGKAVYNSVTDRFTFEAGGEPIDSVRVTARRSSGSEGGPIQLMFARVLGHTSKELEARAAAMMIPRDMAVVIDLSGSMSYDSTLKYWNRNDGGYANTRDCWAALDGPEPSRPYIADVETETEYAGDVGPTIGVMSTWGNALIPGTYSISGDPGLWKIQKTQTQTLAAITSSLTTRGYSSDERTILMGGSKDGTNSAHWVNRCGVMIGLASWHSGRPGGIPGGDGDNVVENNETTWIGYPSWRGGTWTWTDFVNFMQGTSYLEDDAAGFQYRYGLKTFTHWLQRTQRQMTLTNNLWATPQEPLRAVKDAVQVLVDTISAQDTLDHMSLEIFGTTKRHEVNLSQNLQNVPNRLYQMQAGHYDVQTNMGGGLQAAITELSSARGRPNAHKMILFMSDGTANVDEGGSIVEEAIANEWARSQAQAAHDLGYQIYTISVGFDVSRTFMQELAAIGGGQEFYAGSDPSQYEDQLQDIFRTLGGKPPVQLIE